MAVQARKHPRVGNQVVDNTTRFGFGRGHRGVGWCSAWDPGTRNQATAHRRAVSDSGARVRAADQTRTDKDRGRQTRVATPARQPDARPISLQAQPAVNTPLTGQLPVASRYQVPGECIRRSKRGQARRQSRINPSGGGIRTGGAETSTLTVRRARRAPQRGSSAYSDGVGCAIRHCATAGGDGRLSPPRAGPSSGSEWPGIGVSLDSAIAIVDPAVVGAD